MDLENLKTLIALVFIKGDKEFPLTSNKTLLSKKIVKTKAINNLISYKSLLNHFNYFFDVGRDKPNPNPDTIDTLLSYINFDSEKQFINNMPEINFSTDVPNIKIKTSEIVNLENKEDEFVQKEIIKEKSIKAKQTNILSFFNSSIIGKIKGKISQFNFLGFGNKQEVCVEEKEKKQSS